MWLRAACATRLQFPRPKEKQPMAHNTWSKASDTQWRQELKLNCTITSWWWTGASAPRAYAISAIREFLRVRSSSIQSLYSFSLRDIRWPANDFFFIRMGS